MNSKAMSPEDENTTFEKRCKILQAGEWVSLVLSGVGTVVTAMTQNAVFAATPITASLFLNILSRSHQDKKIYEQSSQNLIELQRQYASKLQGVRSEFLGVEFSQDGQPVSDNNKSLEELSTKVKQLESFLEIQGGDYYSQGGAINQEVNILRNHQLEMAETIENLSLRVGNGFTNDSNSHPDEEILDNLDRLSAAVYELEQKMIQLDSNTESEMANLFSPSQNGESDLSGHMEVLQTQIRSLEERVNFIATSDPAYDLEILKSDVQSLIQPLHQQISDLESDLAGQRDLLGQNTSNGSEVDSSELMNLNASVNNLQEQLDTSLSQISNDIADFQTSLGETHQQIGDIQNRINSVQELANQSHQDPAAEIHRQLELINTPLRNQFNQLQTKLAEYNALKTQLDQVQQLAHQTAENLNPHRMQEQINQATAPMMTKISAIEEQIHARPKADGDIMGKLQQVIEPLQSHMVNLEQRINQLAAEGDRQPLLNKIAELQGQLQMVEARMNELPAQTTDHSAQINQLATQISQLQDRLEAVSHKVTEDLTQMPQLIDNNVQEKLSNSLTFKHSLSKRRLQGRRKKRKMNSM
ncbi:MAG: hypothetical protein HC810_07080, partial [Acaryochloridaceae cyanobacterium RL_2_7]|nr:hypothetical protein [Acaryochloridaceae cyanobacterium RL_2_7]